MNYKHETLSTVSYYVIMSSSRVFCRQQRAEMNEQNRIHRIPARGVLKSLSALLSLSLP